MIRIAICDDETAARDRCSQMCAQLFTQIEDESYQICAYSNPVDLLNDIQEHGGFDLIYCDVYMPGLLGTEAMEELRQSGDDCHIVFLTTSTDHAVDAFAVHAGGYLVKPYDYERFSGVSKHIVERIHKAHAEYLPIKTKNGLHRVDYSSISYCESGGHDQIVHLANGERLITRSSSQALFDRLAEDERFFKAGSTYILNLDEVRSVDGVDVAMVDGSKLRIPVRYRKQLSDAFFNRAFGEM